MLPIYGKSRLFSPTTADPAGAYNRLYNIEERKDNRRDRRDNKRDNRRRDSRGNGRGQRPQGQRPQRTENKGNK